MLSVFSKSHRKLSKIDLESAKKAVLGHFQRFFKNTSRDLSESNKNLYDSIYSLVYDYEKILLAFKVFILKNKNFKSLNFYQKYHWRHPLRK